MRIVLAGTRSFGCAVLEDLRTIEGLTGNYAGRLEVVAVVAPPGDRLASLAATRGLPVAERCDEALVRTHRADLVVSAHSHAFIGRRARMACQVGAIGYHPSLLPRHRGRDAVRWTVHMRDPIAGGSVYWLTDHVDGGPIAKQDWCHVHPDDDHHTLWRQQLFPMGVRLIHDVVVDLQHRGEVHATPQDESLSTWEPSWGRPPLHRPELIELGPMPEGLRLVRKEA